MKNNIILSILFFFGSNLAQAHSGVPEKIIGNWINEKTNTWDYGFFEKFAVHNSGFWEYESIVPHKKYTDIVLRQGSKRISLKLSRVSDKLITLARDHGKEVKYRLNQPGFVPYSTPDHTTFKNSGFKPDTVTIRGYYRHLEELDHQTLPSKLPTGPFKITVPDFILNKGLDYFADFDSLGRFEIKFPVTNTQEIAVDWGRLTKRCVVEPGEEIFLFADVDDLIPTEPWDSFESWKNYNLRPKRILYMGVNARVHTEIANYIPSISFFDRQETAKTVASDMGYAHAAVANYRARVDYLETYVRTHPVLSARFAEYEKAFEKYNLAFHLMQYRFHKYEQKKVAFDPGYMDFVNDTISLYENGQPVTFIRDYSNFMRDYVGYYKDLSDSMKFDEKSGRWSTISTSVNSDVTMGELKKRNLLTEAENEVVAQWEEIVRKFRVSTDTVANGKLIRANKKIMDDYNSILQSSKAQATVSGLLTAKSLQRESKFIDSLILNKDLKELLIARAFCGVVDNQREALPEIVLNLLDDYITNPAIRDYVRNVNKQYADISNKGFTYAASLKNTAHLKEAGDADALFSQLVEPYKGKVIYLDFWGTWCGPCRAQMPFASKLKEELAGKDVIFMYLANRSPEEAWKNVIKEMNLTGENVVHYRLSEAQQGMIERKFAINAFPTFMLLDKEGKVVDSNATWPAFTDDVIKAIEALLVE